MAKILNKDYFMYIIIYGHNSLVTNLKIVLVSASNWCEKQLTRLYLTITKITGDKGQDHGMDFR